jgi:two-component system, chemotaxis family, CheB/CheR fusion protein
MLTVFHGQLADVPATWRYGIAIVLAAVAVAVRWLVIPFVGTGAPYLSLFPAVLLATVLLGQGPGVASSLVGALATEIWLVPHTSGVVVSPGDWGRITIVAGSALLIGDVVRRLRETREALVESNRRKDEFLAVLSHELRNPIGTIRSALSILDRGQPLETPDSDRARVIIERQVSYLSRLVDDLLDVSRIKTGKIRIERRPIDLRDLARRTVDDHLALFAANDLTVDLRLADQPTWINGDPTRVAQIIGNLLQNASKFTPPGGRVLVSLERESQSVRLRVRDNGLGLDDNVRPRLFQPFAQADATLHRTRGGLGIGLALVKALVELHRGHVEALSDGPGKGTEFDVVLPLADEREALATQVEKAAAAADARRRRVLIIEDNRDFAAMLQVLLQIMGGHEVDLAENGPKGIEIARRTYPDVVVCDIGLPVMDGYEVARALRAQPATRDALLVALTGYASVDDAKRAVEAGFNFHVPKGGDPEAVVRLLASPPKTDPPTD